MTRFAVLIASIAVLIIASPAHAAGVTITSGPEGPTSKNTPAFTFTGDETECRLDNGPWLDCAGTYQAPQLADGGHLFVVRAKDRSADDVRSFRVDTIAPPISIDGADDATVNDIHTTLTFASPEGGVDTSCAIDSGTAAPCTSPWTTPALANGQHSIRAIATDDAGNQGVATKLVKIAAAPPETVLDGPRGGVRQKELSYGLSADRTSTFECKVDDGKWAKCDGTFKTPALKAGPHTILARATDEAGNVDLSPAGAEVEVEDCTTKVTIGVVEAVADCFTKNEEGHYVADGSVKVNGITFNSIAGHKLEFDVENRKLGFEAVQLKLGGMTLYKGDLGYEVPDEDSVTLADFDMKTHSRVDKKADDTEGALDLEGADNADVQGFLLTGEAKLELMKGGKAKLTGNVALPDVFTDAEGKGLTGTVTIESDNTNGVRFSGIQIKAPLVMVGKIEMRNLWANFAGVKNGDAKNTCNSDSPGLRWEGGAEKVILPTPDKLTVENAGFGFADGNFSYAKGTLTAADPGASIGLGIRVQKIAISVCTQRPKAGATTPPPATIEGRIALTAADGKFKLPDAGLLFRAGDPWTLRAEAPEAIFKGDRDYLFKNVYVQYGSNGALDFGGRFSFALGLKGSIPVGSLDASLTIDAGVTGWIEDKKFNADIDAKGCFAGKFSIADAIPVSFKDICPTITGLVSTKGIALCGNLVVGDKDLGGIGAGYEWGGSVKLMAGTCDVGPWRETRPTASAASPGAKRITLPGKPVVVSVRGIGHAPEVELRGPGGAVIQTPADSNEALKTRTAVAFMNRAERTTYVILAAPRAGRWTVKPLGGAKLAEVNAAAMRPTAKVTAKLRGHKLSYRIPRVKGQTVTFQERGRGVSHMVGSVKTGGSGTLRFTPADGAGGRRTIVAVVEQDGLPRKRVTVAAFVAPARKAPAAPARVTVRSGGSDPSSRRAHPANPHGYVARSGGSDPYRAVTVTWPAAAGAVRYGVRVALPDGRKLFFLRDADERVVRITDAPADGRVVVRVVGLRADNSHGPAATANSSLSGGNR